MATFLLLFSLAAADAGAGEAPRFFIETITVQGADPEPAEIARRQSLLEEGRDYSEAEIRAAVERLRGLPFVRDAAPYLGKGSRRGAYALRIELEPVAAYFFGVDGQQVYFQDSVNLGSSTASDDETALSIKAGRRLFVGRYGEVFASLVGIATEGEGGIEVGYNHYNLFGRPILAGSGLSYRRCCPSKVLPLGLDPELTRWEIEDSLRGYLYVAVPLSAHRGIEASVSLLDGDALETQEVLGTASASSREAGLSNDRFRLREAELKWIHNTTDDPLFPRRGMRLDAGLELTQVRTPAVLAESRSLVDAKMAALAASGARYWSLDARQSWSFSWRGAVGRSELRQSESRGAGPAAGSQGDRSFEVVEATLGLGYSVRLGGKTTSHLGDLYFSLDGEYGYESTAYDSGLLEDPLSRLSLAASIALRNEWGVFRFRLVILDLHERRG